MGVRVPPSALVETATNEALTSNLLVRASFVSGANQRVTGLRVTHLRLAEHAGNVTASSLEGSPDESKPIPQPEHRARPFRSRRELGGLCPPVWERLAFGAPELAAGRPVRALHRRAVGIGYRHMFRVHPFRCLIGPLLRYRLGDFCGEMRDICVGG